MAWKHKILKSCSVTVGNNSYAISKDGTLSPQPEPSMGVFLTAHPDFIEEADPVSVSKPTPKPEPKKPAAKAKKLSSKAKKK
tara:strand:+ start:325 stop:570 length:246 start_codon:yes stop_codon:yes gene_type:complete